MAQDISKYQATLEPYKFRIISDLISLVDLKDKVVLEIGGSNLPNEFVFEALGAKKWVSVDKFWPVHTELWPNHYSTNPIYKLSDISLVDAISKHDYIIFNGVAEDIGPDFFGRFDACISICAFEHIQNLLSVINKIYAALAFGGAFFSQFGPIWSSCGGSHFWVNDALNFNARHPIPDHAHLLLKYADLLDIFLKIFPPNEAEWHAYNVYSGHRCDVNCFFYEDYERIMAMSDFGNYLVRPSVECAVPDDTLSILQNRFAPYKRFDVWEMRIVAHK